MPGFGWIKGYTVDEWVEEGRRGSREKERVKRRGRDREREGERERGPGSLGAGAGPRTRHRLAAAPYLPPPTAIYYCFLTHFSPREFRSTRGRKRPSNKKFWWLRKTIYNNVSTVTIHTTRFLFCFCSLFYGNLVFLTFAF